MAHLKVKNVIVYAVWIVMLLIIAPGCSSSDSGSEEATEPVGSSSSDGAAAASSNIGDESESEGTAEIDLSIELTSTVFNRIRRIPLKHACSMMKDIQRSTTDNTVKTALNWSPPLSWSNLPEGTKSVVLILEGTDNQVWSEQEKSMKNPDEPLAVHWTIWNIPPTVTEFAEAMATTTQLLDIGSSVTQGLNTDGFHGYTGPCPPVQKAFLPSDNPWARFARPADQYYFRIYALDIELDLEANASREDLLDAMEGHILSGGELKGEFMQKPQYNT